MLAALIIHAVIGLMNVKQMAARSGLLEKIGTDQIFETLDEAVQHFQTVRVK